jgi:hypothetical protein
VAHPVASPARLAIHRRRRLRLRGGESAWKTWMEQVHTEDVCVCVTDLLYSKVYHHYWVQTNRPCHIAKAMV